MKHLSPIVLFVYNRPLHTRQTIESLSKNLLASDSILYIYCDASMNKHDSIKVDQVRSYVRSVNKALFKEIVIIEKTTNEGLASSIIDGVSSVVSKHGKVIVLEDDIVTGKSFLKFMNSALDFYQNKKRIWHISGWNYPIEVDSLSDVFIWRGMECWGWATWRDRWSFFKKDAEHTIDKFNKDDISALNLDNSRNVWRQVVDNKSGKINTWAIFWYTTIYENNGMSVNISRSLSQNIGIDGTGANCDDNDVYRIDNKGYFKQSLNFEFEEDLRENKLAVEKIKAFYKRNRGNILDRVVRKLRKIIRMYFS